MADDGRQAAAPEPEGEEPRYCASCGEIFAGAGRYCPNCGRAWSPSSFTTVPAITTMLTELRQLRENGVLDEAGYQAARSVYEARLAAIRPQRTPVGAAPATAPPVSAAPPRRPPRPPRPTLGEWAAARQADILLYLGAFLLTVAALIFVGYQGEALTGGARFAILVLYTLVFLGLGVVLPRWDRVREAGPVFLALGALLVPVNAIALRVQVLGDGSLPDDVLVLLGASLTAAIYVLFAARGYGRLYALPGAVAVFIGWIAFFSVLSVPGEWLGVWNVGGGAVVGALAELLHAPARRWIVRGAMVVVAFGLLTAHVFALDGDGLRAQMPVAYAFAAGLAGVLAYRRPSPRVLAVLPPLGAMLALTAWWAALGLSPGWWCVFIAGAALGYLLLAERDQPERARRWALVAAVVGTLALFAAHGVLIVPPARAALPSTSAMFLAGAAATYLRWRWWEALALLPALGALLGVSVLRALDVPAVWWSYPPLAAAVGIVAVEPWWRRRAVLGDAGWPYALLLAGGVPLGFIPLYADAPAHGVAGFGVGASVFLVATLQVRGALVRPIRRLQSERALVLERQILARIAGALLYAAAAYLNARLGLEGGDRAWVYAGLGVAAWLGLALGGGARRELFGILVPAGVFALGVAATLARDDAARAALILGLGVLGAAAAFPVTRRPSLWLVAGGFAVAALAFAWRRQGYDPALLPIAYAAAAGLLFAMLMGDRRYQRDERGWTVALLSWGPWGVACVAAAILLDRRDDDPLTTKPLAATQEWAVFAIAVAGTAIAIIVEGVRLRQKGVAIAGTAGLLLAGLLAIAIAQPENVQAYTLPAGLYLIATGFAWRRSQRLIDPHLDAHEAVMIAGMLVMLLPAAEQALDPGGGRFGLELIAAGLILLAVGLGLAARWLVVGGVLTLTIVALRWLLTESEVPYWLILGLAGMLLLIGGTLVLLERERWDRARARVRRWWDGTPNPPSPFPAREGGASPDDGGTSSR
ncbi:MAG: SCO7613 C-terminal domain-containing membrane protein [Dehalococcoidia bacterium]